MKAEYNSTENQVIALAGVFQAATLVEQLSTTGNIDSVAFDCSFNSLFTFDAATTIDVFENLSGIQSGLQSLQNYLSGENEKTTRSIAYYILAMLKISTLLKRNDIMSNQIIGKLQTINTQAGDFEFTRSNLVSKIGNLYQETISTMNPRIMVKGEQTYLSNNESASKIRTLLLAGIRASILWYQLGGSKWKMLFVRARYVQATKRLLGEIESLK